MAWLEEMCLWAGLHVSLFLLPADPDAELSAPSAPYLPACHHAFLREENGLPLCTVSQLNVSFIRVTVVVVSLHSSRNPKTGRKFTVVRKACLKNR